MPASFLGAVPHSLIVTVILLETDSKNPLFETKVSLLNSPQIQYVGPSCTKCTFSVIPTWNSSLELSQQISIITNNQESRTNSDFSETAIPTITKSQSDPNQSALVMGVGVGFLLVGPLCIGLFFYVNRRKPEEEWRSELLGDRLVGS
jgi:hypothetical protein